MGYVRDTVNGEIRLEGDDFGAASARIQLPQAPAGAKKMQIVFRAWFDTISASSAQTLLKAWNHSACFGLRFSDGIPKYPASFVAPFDAWLPSDFFGWLTAGPASNDSSYPISGTPTFYSDSSGSVRQPTSAANGFTTSPQDYFGAAVPGNGYASFYEYLQFMNGIGGVLNYASSTPLASNFPTAATSSPTIHLALPANPTTGAKFTGGWEIWASEADKSMLYRLAVNGQSLAGDSMFDVFTTYYRADTYTIHGDTTSNFRPSYDTCAFPRWLVMRHAHHSLKFVFKEARVRYFDWDENELEA